MRNVLRFPRALLCCALVFGSHACDRPDGAAGQSIALEATAGADGAVTGVSARGLSAADLAALRAPGWTDAQWADLLSIRVAGPDMPAVAGRYTVTERGIEFHPRFPFDRGRSYAVRFDPARLPTPRASAVVDLELAIPAPARVPSTIVTNSYPSGEIWPENLLRFYLEFSAPMSRTGGIKFVHILDDAGEEVPDAILEAYADLWNSDFTRLTVLLDPGRVKRGVGPNLKLGRALVAGRGYVLAVDAAFPDGQGQPLAASYRRPFRAVPSEYRALDTHDWRVSPVRAATRDPVVVTFPRPLDHALLERAIGVAVADGTPVAGRVSVNAEERGVTFTPDAPWTGQSVRLVVLTTLEDPMGNRIGKPFEVLPTDRPTPPDTDTVTVPFDVR